MRNPLLPRTLLAAALTAALASACGGSDDSDDAPPSQGATATGEDAPGGAADAAKGKTANGKRSPGGEGPAGGGKGRASEGSGGDRDDPGVPPYVGRFETEVDEDEAAELAEGYRDDGVWSLTLGGSVANLSSRERAFVNRLRVAGDTMRFSSTRSRSPERSARPEARAGEQRPSGDDEEELEDRREERQRRRRAAAAPAEPCLSQTGVYRWSVRGGTITFDLVRDDCATRRLLLGKAWTKP